MKDISFDQLQKIKKQIDKALGDGANPIAAFDADGTLWDADLGEGFFKYQVAQNLLPDLPPNPWPHYLKLHEMDSQGAFVWLAQVNKGLALETVRTWAADSIKANPPPIFNGVREIIRYLQQKNVTVYIVTASVKWAVEPGAKLLGIPQENVLGVETLVENGVITDQSNGIVTWHEGKVTGLMKATGHKSPFFSAGNTMGDLALLDCSTHLRFVNAAAGEDHVNFATERKLIEVAQKRGWLYHVYR